MSKPLKTIVIGTSLTDASDGAVQAGVALARAIGPPVAGQQTSQPQDTATERGKEPVGAGLMR